MAEALFPSSLIAPEIQKSLPEGYVFRPLQRNDYKNGHLDPLHDLAYIGEISEKQWVEQFDLMSKCVGTYYVLVIVDTSGGGDGKIIGTGTLMIERKLYVFFVSSPFVADFHVPVYSSLAYKAISKTSPSKLTIRVRSLV
jgi:glucosamine-phosphate N-acetyltransferase